MKGKIQQRVVRFKLSLHSLKSDLDSKTKSSKLNYSLSGAKTLHQVGHILELKETSVVVKEYPLKLHFGKSFPAAYLEPSRTCRTWL